MNQPTEDRIKRLEEKVRKLEEQITEPIKITRLEIDSGSMHKRLDAVQEDTAVLKIQIEGARADLLKITESQADLRDRLIEHSEDLKVIRDKQDTHSELLGQLISVGEDHTKSFIDIKERLNITATKDDISSMKNDIGRLEAIMMQILKRLPESGGQ